MTADVSTDDTGRLDAGDTGKLAGRAPRGRFARANHVRALDGLRALAIIAVICYHAWPAQVPGGFLGVTVFFVLTGFLTTRSVWVEQRRSGSFDFVRYARRRVERIAPAMLAMVLVTIVASAILSANLLVKVHADALPSALFYSNWHYIASQVSYFQAAGLPSPLTHLWFTSLSMQWLRGGVSRARVHGAHGPALRPRRRHGARLLRTRHAPRRDDGRRLPRRLLPHAAPRP